MNTPTWVNSIKHSIKFVLFNPLLNTEKGKKKVAKKCV